MLTSVILSKNEGTKIENVIRSVKFADEILLIDDNSTDNTSKIAQRFGAKVFKRALGNDFSNQRNFALRQAQGEWVFFIDADEIVSPELKNELLTISNAYQGFYVVRKNLFLGKVVGEEKIIRVARRNSGKWERMVHEEWKVKGRIGNLKGYLIHESASTLKIAISKINSYSSLHARQNLNDEKKSNLFKIIFYPKAKLVHNLFTGKGFVFALLHSLHSFLAWSKQWLLQKDLQKKQ